MTPRSTRRFPSRLRSSSSRSGDDGFVTGDSTALGPPGRLQRAAEEAAHHGRPPGPGAVIRRGRQRRRRLLGGTASLVALVLVAGALGTGRLVSRQTPLAPPRPPPRQPPRSPRSRRPSQRS